MWGDLEDYDLDHNRRAHGGATIVPLSPDEEAPFCRSLGAGKNRENGMQISFGGCEAGSSLLKDERSRA